MQNLTADRDRETESVWVYAVVSVHQLWQAENLQGIHRDRADLETRTIGMLEF